MALLALALAIFSPATAQGLVAYDQLGYRPQDEKVAFLQDIQASSFEILDATSHTPVFHGAINTVGMDDVATGKAVFILDFSRLTKPGTYEFWIPGLGPGPAPFRIANDVYDSAARTSLQSFYYQRCGTEVNVGTPWHHPPCHLRDAVFYNDPSQSKDVIGGWHDAGDYNKFVVTTGVSAAFLLYLYEARPDLFPDGSLTIPEAHNKIPDILDEAKWGLEWLLKMQAEDGGLYTKVSIRKWTGEHLPDRETDPRFIFAKSSAATGIAAAVTALGARLFRSCDPEFARQLMKASMLSWKYLTDHPGPVPPGGFRNPPGVEGGEYGDQDDQDERLWAAVELFRLTGSREYQDYFLSNFEREGGPNYPVSWMNTANFAYYSYLHTTPVPFDQAARNEIMSRIGNYADQLVLRIRNSGYRTVLLPAQYYWGSNSVLLGYACDLTEAYEILHRPQYLAAARDQLHYILGRNAFGISFVTGVGSNPVRHPYHQFSMLLGVREPVPGMVVGGPNSGSRLRAKEISTYPGFCYEDNQKNYFVNETAINYTAPFVFLSGYFSSPSSLQAMKGSK